MTLITNLDTAHVNQRMRQDRQGPVRATSLASFLRPANTTQYGINDVVGTAATAAMEFPNCAQVNGGGGKILYAQIAYDAQDVNFALYIFDEEPTNRADNAAAAFAVTDAAICVGIWQFEGADVLVATAGALGFHYKPLQTAATVGPEIIERPYVCASGSKSLYGHLVDRNAHTPASATKIHIRLGLEID